jgi:epoxyqueuosine reductase QueG
MQDSGNISEEIKTKAKELGFLECAILPVGFLEEDKEHLDTWLEAKMHGEMDYMARNVEKRLNPRLLVENTKTIIVVILNYYPEQTQTDPEAPVISKYAYGTDYHFVLKNKLKKLLAFIQTVIKPCNGRAFTDSAPDVGTSLGTPCRTWLGGQKQQPHIGYPRKFLFYRGTDARHRTSVRRTKISTRLLWYLHPLY